MSSSKLAVDPSHPTRKASELVSTETATIESDASQAETTEGAEESREQQYAERGIRTLRYAAAAAATRVLQSDWWLGSSSILSGRTLVYIRITHKRHMTCVGLFSRSFHDFGRLFFICSSHDPPHGVIGFVLRSMNKPCSSVTALVGGCMTSLVCSSRGFVSDVCSFVC